MLQDNSGWGYTTLGVVNQSYLPNHWYRMQVNWGPSGTITGQLYDSNGTTLTWTPPGPGGLADLFRDV